jgi:hypothetical protein
VTAWTRIQQPWRHLASAISRPLPDNSNHETDERAVTALVALRKRGPSRRERRSSRAAPGPCTPRSGRLQQRGAFAAPRVPSKHDHALRRHRPHRGPPRPRSRDCRFARRSGDLHAADTDAAAYRRYRKRAGPSAGCLLGRESGSQCCLLSERLVANRGGRRAHSVALQLRMKTAARRERSSSSKRAVAADTNPDRWQLSRFVRESSSHGDLPAACSDDFECEVGSCSVGRAGSGGVYSCAV